MSRSPVMLNAWQHQHVEALRVKLIAARGRMVTLAEAVDDAVVALARSIK